MISEDTYLLVREHGGVDREARADELDDRAAGLATLSRVHDPQVHLGLVGEAAHQHIGEITLDDRHVGQPGAPRGGRRCDGLAVDDRHAARRQGAQTKLEAGLEADFVDRLESLEMGE